MGKTAGLRRREVAMRNKAMWFRYFVERSGPKQCPSYRPPALGMPAPHRWLRASRPSLMGLKKAGAPR